LVLAPDLLIKLIRYKKLIKLHLYNFRLKKTRINHNDLEENYSMGLQVY